MKTLHASIDIAAPAERVWAILTDFAGYPAWNPFIPRASGRPEAGARLKVRIEPPGGTGMTFRPTVLEAAPSQALRWRGRLLLPGLFDGEHGFRLEPLAGGRTRLVQEERFTGLLVPLLAKSLDRNTLAGFRAMNAALRARAEAPVAATCQEVAG